MRSEFAEEVLLPLAFDGSRVVACVAQHANDGRDGGLLVRSVLEQHAPGHASASPQAAPRDQHDVLAGLQRLAEPCHQLPSLSDGA